MSGATQWLHQQSDPTDHLLCPWLDGPQGQGPGATLCFLSGLWPMAVWGGVWQCGLLDASVSAILGKDLIERRVALD